MTERLEEELADDLFYEEAEGPSEMFEEEDEFEEDYDAFEEAELEAEEEWEGAEEEWEGAEEDYYEDEFEEEGFEEFEDYDEEYDDYAEEAEEELEDVMAFALGAEDTDEFLKSIISSIFGGRRRRRRRRGRRRGGILSRILGILPILRAEGATEEEVLEAFIELAAKDPKARPLVAGAVARKLVKCRGAKLPPSTRKKMIKEIGKAIKTLTKKRGKKAVRAIGPIARSVKRTAITKSTPPVVRAKIVKRTAMKVAKRPNLTKKLSKPSPKAKEMVAF